MRDWQVGSLQRQVAFFYDKEQSNTYLYVYNGNTMQSVINHFQFNSIQFKYLKSV